MNSIQVGVTLLGLATIAWINWYFFVAGRPAAVAAVVGDGGIQRVRVEVEGGYAPAVIRVRAGSPVRLDFHRDETNPCTEEVVIPDFGIRTYLPAHRTTPVSFTPAAGTYEFTCGMGMVRGTIIAEPEA
ncbi:MAG: cupredoxin domain-containing protein [Gemmatimonadales bacterium]